VIEAATLIGLSVAVFAATNVDDIFLLLGFFADPRFRAGRVAVGQFVGIGALVAASVTASLISLVLPPAYVGLLGLLPILVGVKRLFDTGTDAVPAPEARGDTLGQVASVAAVTIANGGDNIGVYTPWFAISTAGQIGVIVVVFAAMTGLWLAAGHWLVNHRTVGAPIRRYGHLVLPFVLIGLGVAILYEGGSMELLPRD
jgi:cadmium resistance protein CadD (predicted permease)